ncbi:hypothetical protein FD977_06870 [Polynucleobacter sp. AP-Elch-400A-B2]|jgi:hypothetical protein|uniref:hypothetical protein n=1 Tax=Polynucleobacter sp. AP-Elch-400A-B2 TaxID=2576930 RepID=UPI001BFD9F0F|nr:hypothetical protein [Polynucleobacter sp. AP-Elch-400A-B2]QWE23994.1 hypothetical protein FD977_06870 [Polynucleobacter sp. AP-Elch-400A-B2]
MKLLQKISFVFLPALLVACISSQPYPKGTALSQPVNPPQMRAPQIGQQWVYNVRNVFNQEIVDVVTETVVAVGPQVRIERTGLKYGRLPDEIQQPWGFILQDPHWSPPQKFLQAMPLWPEQLVSGWSGFYRNRYQVAGYPDNDYYLGLNIDALKWERVKVPAGEFNTLLYRNGMPFFTSNDFSRVANIRSEDIWLAPEIGRWVIRRSSGQYLWAGMFWGAALWEDYLEWELVSWK